MKAQYYIWVFALLLLGGVFWGGCDMLGQTEVFVLDINVSHPERGSVVPTDTLTREYEAGTEIELEAFVSREEEFRFAGWEGDIISTENPHTFTIRQDTEVTAVFGLHEFTLTILIEGEGTVTHEAVGTRGGPADQPDKDYKFGTRVQLTAEPAEGWRFVQWRGENFVYNRTNNPTGPNINDHPGMFDDRTITAIFEEE